MTPLTVHQRKQALDNLLALASTYPAGTPTNRDLTHFACVRICGFLEKSLRDIYYQYAVTKNAPLARFVSKRLDRSWTPWPKNLETLAGQFDPTWQSELESFLNDRNRREAVSGLIRNRIKIAHGEYSPLGLVQLKEWYKAVIEYLDFVVLQTGI